ncbi:hypothetical protein PG985_004918 [Apiospora marii]|uniref:uncharacterized protein n=1 Tax=Apiospora marii TaxID=335849 RepID=UPI0031300B00
MATEWFRIAMAGAMSACYLLEPFKKVETSARNVKPFIWLTSLVVLVTLMDMAAWFSWSDLSEDEIPTATAIYGVGAISQLNGLWDFDKQPPWHSYIGLWTLMLIFDTLLIVQHTMTVLSASTTPMPALFGSTVAALSRSVLVLALLCWFIGTGATAQTKGVGAVDTKAPKNNNNSPVCAPFDASDNPDDDNDEDEDDEKVAMDSDDEENEAMLQKLIEKQIDKAGSKWKWLCQFFDLFWPWMWPQGQRMLQLRLGLTTVITLLQTFIDVIEPKLYGEMVDSFVEATHQRSLCAVWKPFLKLIVIRVVNSPILPTLKDLLWLEVDMWRDRKRDTDIREHLFRLDASFYDRFQARDILRAVNLGYDVTGALDFIAFTDLPNLVAFIGAAYEMSDTYGPRVVLVLVYVMLFHAICAKRSFKSTISKWDEVETTGDKLNQRFENGVFAWVTVKRHNQAGVENTSFADEWSIHQKQHRLLAMTNATYHCASRIITQSGYYIALLLYLARGITTSTYSTGNLVSFNSYWNLLLVPMLSIINSPRRLLSQVYAAARLSSILETKPSIMEGAETLDPGPSEVIIKNAEFSYGKKLIFKDLNLKFPGGQTSAIIGRSGVGKSTILDALLRIRELSKGTVTIGKKEIHEIKFESLRSHIGIMPQIADNLIFDESIMYNVRYAKPSASDEDVHRACGQAQLHEDIEAREKGYSSNARTLSGGQKQRLLCARLFLGQPQIILLDEPVASLDGTNAAKIQQELAKHFAGRTIIMVSHLMSSVMTADRIYVLGEEGRVIQTGTHNSLMLETGGEYAGLWRNHMGRAPVERTVEEMLDAV